MNSKKLIVLLFFLMAYLPKSYSAMSFDGTDDYVEVAAASSGPLTVISTGNFTLSAWASNVGTLGTFRWMISNWNTTGTHWGLNSNGKYGGYFGSSSEFSSNYVIPTDGSWHHYVATRVGGTVYFYVDGNAQGTAAAGTGSMGAGVPTRIGSRGGSVAQIWFGHTDDVRVYNRALLDSEISSLALSRSRLLITDGLVGWWKLDEGTDGAVAGGVTAKDYSGNGNTGTPTNGPIWRASSAINYP